VDIPKQTSEVLLSTQNIRTIIVDSNNANLYWATTTTVTMCNIGE